MDSTRMPIALVPMAHLAEANCAGDDWAGISDWSTRKRRQNRLNQRAYRRRRKAVKVLAEESSHFERNSTSASRGYELRGQEVDGGHDDGTNVHNSSSNLSILDIPLPERYNSQLDATWASHIPVETSDNDGATTCSAHPQIQGAFIVKVASKTITFDLYEPAPILSDHLLSLIKYNLYRAVAANSWSIGIDPRLMHSDITSPFTSNDPATYSFCQSLPPSLRPTALQRSVPHHPYIDLFPFPNMRDRLIQLGHTLNEDKLCEDFAGESLDLEFGEHTGLIVWGEPWDPKGWELAEPLWKKWSLLLKGCLGLLDSTNYWRQKRDEAPLVEIP